MVYLESARVDPLAPRNEVDSLVVPELPDPEVRDVPLVWTLPLALDGDLDLRPHCWSLPYAHL